MENLRKDALQEGTASKGGYLVVDILSGLENLFVEYGLARKIVPTMTVGKTDTVQIPVGSRANVTAYIVAETADVTASQGSFSQKTINLKKLRVKVPISSELLDDATEDMAREVAEQMAWAVAYKEDYEVFRGDGTDFTGFIVDSGITVKDVDGAYMDMDDISLGIATIEGYGGRRSDMRLVVRPETLHYIRILKDDDNNYLFTSYTANNPILAKGVIGEIFGVPVYVTDVFTSTAETTGAGTVTATDALLFEKRAGKLVVRKDLVQERDRDFDADVWNLYVTERVGFVVVHPTLVYHFDQVKNQ